MPSSEQLDDTAAYEPTRLPDGYPYGADAATKRAFLVSKAPRFTADNIATLRALLGIGKR